MRRKTDTVIIGGIRTATLSRKDLTGLILSRAEDGAPPRLCFDINGQGLAMSRWDAAYRADLEAADLIHADGQPLVIASRLFTRTPIAERSATTDMFHDLASGGLASGARHFFLGGPEQVNARCAQLMAKAYPGLAIAGRHHGFFTDAEDERICDLINESGAEIVWVGLGKPREQAFCVRNRHRLRARWLITCGGCFNFVTGGYSRAPRWMQDAGFEWLHRMLTRPRQLTMRYLTTSPVAVFLLLTETRETA